MMDLSGLKNLVGNMASQLAEKIKNDPALLQKFKEDPVAALKSMNLTLPEESLKGLAEKVMAEINK